MSKKSVGTQEKELPEQEQRAVAVSSGGAANQNTWRNIGLIVGREYKNRVTQRSFIISSIIILVLVVIAAFVPTVIQYFTSTSNSQTKIVVVNNAGTMAGLNGDALACFIGTALNGTAAQATGTNTPVQNTSGKPPFAITLDASNLHNGPQYQEKNDSLNIHMRLDRSTNKHKHL